MLAKRKAAFAAMFFFMCGLPQTTEYISGLQTSCKTMGTVEEGKTTVIYFNLTSDPMEGKLNYADICLKRGQADAADSENGKAGKHACTGDKIFSGEWQDPGNRLTYRVKKSGYKFVGIVDHQLALIIENASKTQSGQYFVEDSSESPWLNCSLNVTGATEKISGPGEDREEKPTQKSVQDTDGTRWIGLWVFLGVILMLQFAGILGIWCQRDNKKFIQTVIEQQVIKMLESIKDNNEGRGTQHPRTNEGSEDMVESACNSMRYATRLQRNQSRRVEHIQQANDGADADMSINRNATPTGSNASVRPRPPVHAGSTFSDGSLV